MFKCVQTKLEASAITYKVSRQLTENEANTKKYKLTAVSLGSPCLPALDKTLRCRALKWQADPLAHGCSLPGALPDARDKFGTWYYLQRLAVFQGIAWERGFSFASQIICVQTAIFLSLLRKS